jgi:hypothetical protein
MIRQKLGGLLALGIMAALPAGAGAATGQESWASGSFSGQAGLHWQREKAREAEPGEAATAGFAAAHAGFSYETPPWDGFSLGLGAWGTTRLDERHSGDYREEIAKDLVINNAFARYHDAYWGDLTLGRQDVDLEWLIDYMEGAMARLTPREELAISLGWARRRAITDPDEVVDFTRLNGNRGVYVLDVKYQPLAWLELNPYYYHAPREFRAPGLRAVTSYEPAPELAAATMVQWVRSTAHRDSVLADGLENGGLVWLEQSLDYRGLELAGGYLKTDRRGAGGIDSFGDQQPFEEGNRLFSANARTFYLGAAYEVGPVTLAALYGTTRYDEDGERLREKELNLTAASEIMPNLEIELLYAKVSNDIRADSYQLLKTGLVYRF